MKKTVLFRWIVAVLFAVPFVFVAVAGVQASTLLDETPVDPGCQECHPAIHGAWKNSHHGQAMTDPNFAAAWEEQGQPNECLPCHTTGYDPITRTWESDGITCEACHAPMPSNHPDQPMPTDRSASLCGGCHQETVLEWKVSHHHQAELTCVDCHGQHSTSLKGQDAQALCSSCHQERVLDYTHSAHSMEGLLCADCHLGSTGEVAGEGHALKDHSFHVNLSTCTDCHADEMHDPVGAVASVSNDDNSSSGPKLDAMAAVTDLGVSAVPDPISPIYYALIAGLIGMAFGLLVAPWVERWYRSLDQRTRVDE